jgi:hypothetical protein
LATVIFYVTAKINIEQQRHYAQVVSEKSPSDAEREKGDRAACQESNLLLLTTHLIFSGIYHRWHISAMAKAIPPPNPTASLHVFRQTTTKTK